MKSNHSQNTNFLKPDKQTDLFVNQFWGLWTHCFFKALKQSLFIASFLIISYLLAIYSSSLLTLSNSHIKLLLKYANENISLSQARMLSILIKDDQTIHISIDQNERIFIDDRLVEQKDIENELKNWRHENQYDHYWELTAIFIIDKYNKAKIVQHIIQLLEENNFSTMYFVVQEDI
jgi:biopolymer transport protein ExbD